MGEIIDKGYHFSLGRLTFTFFWKCYAPNLFLGWSRYKKHLQKFFSIFDDFIRMRTDVFCRRGGKNGIIMGKKPKNRRRMMCSTPKCPY